MNEQRKKIVEYKQGIGIALLLLVLGGCVSVPTGPSVMVLPPKGKPFEQFQAEDAKCRQWAGQKVGTTYQDYQYEAQRRYDIYYQQCMYAYGNMIPGVRYTSPARQMPPPPNLEPSPPATPAEPSETPETTP
jgi:hypothetical protein